MSLHRSPGRRAPALTSREKYLTSALKPLVIVLTLVNIFLFVSLYGNQGEGSPLFSSYGARDTSSYRLSDLYLFQKVAFQVERDYVDKDRIHPAEMFEAALEQIERDIPEVLFHLDVPAGVLEVTVDSAHTALPLADIDSLHDVVTSLRSALEFVEAHLYSDMPMQEIEYAAINGFLSVLDPHSILLPPDMARDMDVQIQGEFGGLGITISLRGEDRRITVIATLPDTPAARAGLKPGDRILQIEDEPTINMSLDEAVDKLRGPVRTPVTILVERQGWDRPHSITIIRETIHIPSVKGWTLRGGVGYVRIKTFQHNTARELHAELERLNAESGGLRGLVLDLRGNPGGPLTQAIEVADTFVDRGTIVSTVKGIDGEVEDEAARSRGTEPPYPMVVLVDAESASASEIVAGALKNLDRAVVVGDRTFGKGSVQNLYSYPNDAKLKLTMAKYLTPGRKSIQSLGITPDIRLEPVHFDEKSAHLYTSPVVYRESDLDSHLEQEDEALEDPLAVVRYFSAERFSSWTTDSEDEVGEDTTAPSVDDDTYVPEDDFQVAFCRDLLLEAGRSTRSATLAGATRFLETVTREQADRIDRQFAATGIDWSRGRETVPPQLKATLSLGTDGSVQAGDRIELTVTVSNVGDTPAYQVRTESESDLGVLNAIECLFGRIDPGERRTATRTVRFPSNLFALKEPVKLRVFRDAEVLAGEVAISVHVLPQPSPRFAYTLTVVDDGTGMSRGNGDGRIQPGEEIDLLLFLQNLGTQPVEKVFSKLSVKGAKKVRVRRGTVNIPEIGAGDWAVGRFSLSVGHGFRGRRIRAEIVSGDARFLFTPSDSIVLEVDDELPGLIEEAPGRVTANGDRPLELRGCAALECPTFAMASTDAVLDVTGKVPGWFRVRVPMGSDVASGWVPGPAVHWVSDSWPLSGGEEFKAVFHAVPPLVTVTYPELEVPWEDDTVVVRGEVTDDRSIHALYLFVNDRKISFQVVDPAAWQRTEDGKVRYPFSQSVSLEEGSNVVEVWSQDEDRHQAVDVFQVFRLSRSDGSPERSVLAVGGATN